MLLTFFFLNLSLQLPSSKLQPLSLNPSLTVSLWSQWKPAPPQTISLTQKANQNAQWAHSTPRKTTNHSAGISMNSQEAEGAGRGLS